MSQPQYKQEYKMLQKAKMQLMSIPNTVFYTTILFSLKQIIIKDPQIQTAATDGKNLFINPGFWMSLTPDERIGVLAHEVLHVALSHMTRVGSRDHEKWNIAGDHVINLILRANGYKLPAGGLWDGKYADFATEEVYAQLPQKPKPPGGGLDIIYTNGKPDDVDDLQNHITDVVLKATTQAQISKSDLGSVPGEVEIELQKQLNPKLPWNVILQNYMSSFAKNDFSWSKPNRRFQPDYYLPTQYSEAICNIASAFDVSGSTTDEMVGSYATNLTKIQQDLKPEKMIVIGFDTRIKSEQEFTAESNIVRELKFTGRGGTELAPVMEWIEKNKPEVMLIFTDGEFHTPPKPKGTTDIIWIINDDPAWKCDYGKVIHYDTN